MRPAIVSGIVIGDSPISYWPTSSLSLIIVPEAFAKVNSSQFPSLPTLETKREMEPRCIPQLFLGSLQATHRSIVGQFLLCPWKQSQKPVRKLTRPIFLLFPLYRREGKWNQDASGNCFWDCLLATRRSAIRDFKI